MKKNILFALTLMGFTSLVVQTLLIREFLITFYGNELTIGIILANWIALEAIGSFLASKFSQRSRNPFFIYALLQAGICIWLPFGIYFIRTIKSMLGLTLGEAAGILPVFFSSFFIMAPLSIFDGSQFPFGTRILGDFTKRPFESSGRVYILEALGFIFAGPLFTYLLITKFNSFQIAFFVGGLNLVSGFLLLADKLKEISAKVLSLVITLLFVFCVFMFFKGAFRLQLSSIDRQYKGQNVLDYQNSVYGNLTVTSQDGQYTFYNDGVPIITTPLPDIAYVEELVHFGMLTLNDPKDILLLSGGAGGIIAEILKYPIQNIDYAELDPLLIELIKKFPTDLTQKELNDRHLFIRYIDPRRFVKLTNSRYDLILVNLPAPVTLQLNRFYTKEFYRLIKSKLKDGGIFCFSLPGSLSYINEELKNLNGCIINTLREEFPHIYVIPGDFNIYLASKNPFLIDDKVLYSRLLQNNIPTRLITRQYLEYRLNKRWQTWFWDSLKDISKIRKNSDLVSSGVFYGISYWSGLFSPKLNNIFGLFDKLTMDKILIALFALGLTFIVCSRFFPKLKKASVGFAIGSTGFVGMSFDLIIIYAYQSYFGFVFHHLALLVTAFMAGLTAGGWLMTKRLARIKDDFALFSKIELVIAAFCILAGIFLLNLDNLGFLKFPFIFFVLSFVSGFLVGSEFPLANKVYWQAKTSVQTAGVLYATDLLGAWFAALAVSFCLVPTVGIFDTCVILMVFKIISLALVITGRT